MAEKVVRVCDIDDAPATHAVRIQDGRASWTKDLCDKHFTELLQGAQELRPGRRAASATRPATRKRVTAKRTTRKKAAARSSTRRRSGGSRWDVRSSAASPYVCTFRRQGATRCEEGPQN